MNSIIIKILIYYFKTFYKIKLRQLEKWNATEESKRDSVETNPLKIFLTAIDNCKPVVQMSAVRKAGILYQVPVPISEISREFRAMKFLVNSCRRRDKVRFYDRLANEILLAYQNEVSKVIIFLVFKMINAFFVFKLRDKPFLKKLNFINKRKQIVHMLIIGK